MADEDEWDMQDASCSRYATLGPGTADIWFDDIHEQTAKEICMTCPVIATCYEIVMRQEETMALRFGVVAGLNAKERYRRAKQERKERQEIPA